MNPLKIVIATLVLCCGSIALASDADRVKPVQSLLTAEGSLEAARYLGSFLDASDRAGLAGQEKRAAALLDRIYPACRALIATNAGERVGVALEDAFMPDLAAKVSGGSAPTNMVFAPVYPPGFKPATSQVYGVIQLTSGDMLAWATPKLWSGKPDSPLFAGWKISDREMTLGENCTSLVRSDFRIDDAEVEGEVQVESGCVCLILRSDVILKFHSGKVSGSGGNITVKIGYDNLRTSTFFAEAPELESSRWYSFKATLQGRNLVVVFDGQEVFRSSLVRDPRLGGSKLGTSGYFGFGGIQGAGGFRNVRLTALSPAGRQVLPRLKSAPAYATAGQPAGLLSGGTNELVCLVHTNIQPFTQGRFAISNNTLRLEGAPYTQVSRKGSASSHFKVSGRMRFIDDGSAWFRANSGLLFGVRCKEGELPFAIKHTTGNFNSADEEIDGGKVLQGEWHTWELEYHEPLGVFSFDGNRVMVSVARSEHAVPSQFGVSSYNTPVEVADVVIQKLGPAAGSAATLAQARDYYAQGFKAAAGAIAALEKLPGPPSGALALLKESALPVAATQKDFDEVAAGLRQRNDWPGSLEVLEAGFKRFEQMNVSSNDAPQLAQARSEAETVWKTARSRFNEELKTVKDGEIGADNILRTGERAGVMFRSAAAGESLIYIPATKELEAFSASGNRIIRRVRLPVEPGLAVAGEKFLICVEARTPEKRKRDARQDAGGDVRAYSNVVWKLNLETGEAIASTNLPGPVLWLARHPRKAGVFVSVDENSDPRLADVSKYKVYFLEEETLEAKDAHGIGMFMAADPAGRYLYSGFNLRIGPGGTAVDTAWLRMMPVAGRIDHLVRYRVTATGLEMDGQLPFPGLDGHSIVADPDGRMLCYVAPHPGAREKRSAGGFRIAALRSFDFDSEGGSYDAGGMPESMVFSSSGSEAYVLAGNEVRIFDSKEFKLKGSISLPAGCEKSRIIQILPSADGCALLVMFAGKSAGVYVHRLKADTKGSDSKSMAKESLYTPEAEKAARVLLESQRLVPTNSQLYALPVTNVVEDETELTLEKMNLPKRPSELPQAGQLVPVERMDELRSFEFLAGDYPWCWLSRCAVLQKEFPADTELKLMSARVLERSGNPGLASQLAGNVLEVSGRKGRPALESYRMLARLYAAESRTNQVLTALAAALEIDPLDAGLNAEYSKICLASGLSRKARNHKLISWCLFPSQAELEKELVDCGALAPQQPRELEANILFKQAVGAVGLIKNGDGCGTGFLIGRNGRMLTNHHVVEGGTNIVVTLKNAAGVERSMKGRLIAFDALRDAALLELDGDVSGINPLKLINSDAVEPGERVVAIGNPGMGNRVLMHTATDGMISACNRTVGDEKFFQISAPVNPGNSGGPLFNARGQVIGMVTLKSALENVGFAVPATDLLKFVERRN